MAQGKRPDHVGVHEAPYRKNRQRILATQDICYLCGKPVDKSLKYPDPWSATVDHIIPIDKGGHPSSIDNLALAHFRCNRLKSDKLPEERMDSATQQAPSNRNLPHSIDWDSYRP